MITQNIGDPRTGRTLIGLAKESLEAEPAAPDFPMFERWTSAGRMFRVTCSAGHVEPRILQPAEAMRSVADKPYGTGCLVVIGTMGSGKSALLREITLLASRFDRETGRIAAASECSCSRPDNPAGIAPELIAFGTAQVREDRWPRPSSGHAGALCGLIERAESGDHAGRALASRPDSLCSSCRLVPASLRKDPDATPARYRNSVLAIVRLRRVIRLMRPARTADAAVFILIVIAVCLRYGYRHEPSDGHSLPIRRYRFFSARSAPAIP